MNTFLKFLSSSLEKNSPVFFDGAMGTMIQKLSLLPEYKGISYSVPEDLNFYRPELIKKIHTLYLEAGSNVLSANSFGANPLKTENSASHSALEYIAQSIKIQKEAIKEFEDAHPKTKGTHFASWDSGQIGKLLEPMGSLTFDQAYSSYKEAAICAEKNGAQLAIIETMSDLYEVKAAVLAIKENTSLPIVASMTFQSDLRTLTGADVLTVVTYLESLHVDLLGFNCGGSLEEDEKLADLFLEYSSIPLLVQPNAGLPEVIDGKDVFKTGAEEFSEFQKKNFLKGISVLGGCCGTTPEHIAAMTKKISGIKRDSSVTQNRKKTDTFICSSNKTVQIGGKAGPVIIGERINPTGKKKCKEALLNSDMNFVLKEAESQIENGAEILDVNVGLPGIDEKETMCLAIKTIQSVFNTPLQIDSSEVKVLEKALRYYNGKALVNSVNGKQEVMDLVFPLIKHYGGAVVALCIDEEGIAPSAEGRVKVAEKIIAEAAKYSISPKDIFIDTLTLTVSSEQKAALETIRAIEILKEKYGKKGLQFVLGVSNISFGLPRRDIVNSRFFELALYAGLTGCIINPLSESMMDSFRSYRALSGYDKNCIDFIQSYTDSLDPSTKKYRDKIIEDALKDGLLQKKSEENSLIDTSKNNEAATKDLSSPENSEKNKNEIKQNPEEAKLISIIEKGFKDQSASQTEILLKNTPPLEIINRCIVPALDNVGSDFEKGKKFLPQLLLSAETVSASFAKIKENLASSGIKEESKGLIVLATVYGDIHDIGKNIVKAMLENYGYTVIDLGKNVPVEKVVSTVIENKIQLLGLSALMTTTVANMEVTIKELKKALEEKKMTCKIVVGGAVLTADYAEKIGADYYSKDAMETVAVARKVFGK